MYRLGLAALLVLTACSGGSGDGGEFSPLVQPGSAGRYDLTLEGVDSIRAAELAPGAAPARPVVEGDRATRKGHFIATYAGEADPAVIGGQMLAALEAAPFLESISADFTEEGGFLADVDYRTKGSEGTLTLTLTRTDQPNRLELVYEVEEKLR